MTRVRTSSDRLNAVPAEITELATRGMPRERFAEEACERLRHAMGFDSYCVRFCDPGTSVPNGAVSELDCVTAPITYRHEYVGRDFASLPRLRDGGDRVAVLSEATGGELARSGRWRDVLEPLGVPYELTGLATRGDRVWGQVMLYRKGGRGDFGAPEAEALSRALAPLAEGIRAGFLAPSAEASVAHHESPAVIVMDEDNRVAETTPLPADWLQALSPMPELVSPLALQVLAEIARGEPARSALSRFRNPAGGWLTVHATAMGGTGPERVAIVVQPARASEVAQLMLATLNLTRGEQAVVERVMQGQSTKQMAADMYLSPHTVQDRLKSIFAKLGVRSRREVVALLEQRLAPS
jgi:DNA-binding CsgD family transcriptional regulator